MDSEELHRRMRMLINAMNCRDPKRLEAVFEGPTAIDAARIVLRAIDGNKARELIEFLGGW